jgi:hypothetical protein
VDGYPLDQVKHIKARVKTAVTENSKLCKARAKGFNLPIINGGFFSLAGYSVTPTLTPNEGKLKEFLDVALLQLDKLEENLLKLSSKTPRNSSIFVEEAEQKAEDKTESQLKHEAIIAELSKPIIANP